MALNRAFIAIGSNIDKQRNLPESVRQLVASCRVVRLSSVYETEPVGRTDQPTFFNAAALVLTELRPAALRVGVLNRIEDSLGRQRTGDRFAPRTIDLDLVLFNREVLSDYGRQIPSPDLLHHAHVIVPVAELDPGLPHPITGEPLGSIASRLSSSRPRGGVRQSAVRLRADLDLSCYLEPTP